MDTDQEVSQKITDSQIQDQNSSELVSKKFSDKTNNFTKEQSEKADLPSKVEVKEKKHSTQTLTEVDAEDLKEQNLEFNVEIVEKNSSCKSLDRYRDKRTHLDDSGYSGDEHCESKVKLYNNNLLSENLQNQYCSGSESDDDIKEIPVSNNERDNQQTLTITSKTKTSDFNDLEISIIGKNNEQNYNNDCNNIEESKMKIIDLIGVDKFNEAYNIYRNDTDVI